MRKTIYRGLWGVAGVLLMIAGVLCMIWEEAALASLAAILGVVMLVSGVVDIFIFCGAKNRMYGAGPSAPRPSPEPPLSPRPWRYGSR